MSPEEISGLLGNLFFWWVNDFIVLGYSKILSADDMPPLPSYLNSMKLRKAMQVTWDQRKKPDYRFSLLLLQFRLLWRPNLLVIVPRCLFTAFRYCQPILVTRTIAYVNNDLPALENRSEGFQLIVFTFFIYMGMAISKGMYDIRLHRLNVMSHMTIIGLIYNRSFTAKDGTFDAAAAVTLMTNDAEQVMFTADLFHELWSQTIEFSIGMYLLSTQLGWVCVIPVLAVLFTSQGSKFVTSRIVKRQSSVSMATQQRISRTKSVLDSMKNIKIMGLVAKMAAKVQTARSEEISKYIKLNRLFVAFNASASMLTIFTPAITLIIYSIQAELRGEKFIDVNMAFTSLAIVGMVTSPANTVLTMSAHMASAIASFDRIQSYLAGLDREDKRENIMSSNPRSDVRDQTGGRFATHPDDSLSAPSIEGGALEDVALSIVDATIRPSSNSNPVLRNITTTIKQGSLVVCCGAVGTGKTSLVKALLGDLPTEMGVIKTAVGLVAYCSQTPWLPSGTIKSIIQGPLELDHAADEAWYRRVVEACDLGEDLHQLPDGDQTVIGSRGITLSGGQKHRLALARAVYAHHHTVILDDVLSALDSTTEMKVVEQLFDPSGLFKEMGTTVLLITHATHHLSLADHIIVLNEDGAIAEQGSWEGLRKNAGYISQVILKKKHAMSTTAGGSAKKHDEIRQSRATKPDPNMQESTRRTGDITLYERGGQDTRYYSGIYFLLALGTFVCVTMAIANIFLIIAPRSGQVLHARLLHTVMAAFQSFFGITETGTTLNRFSADILMIDRRLPPSLLQVGQCLFTLLSQAILLAVVQPIMAITLPFTFITIYFIQKFYLATSRQLRLLDLETKALLNSSFLDTLEGVATIRAFGWQRAFVIDNVKKLDQCLRPWYLMMCLQRWLNITMDLIVLCIAMLVVSFAVAFKDRTTGGQIGIALNVVLLANQSLLRLVESWTVLETSLGAISRIRAFERDVMPESKPGEDQQTDDGWPAHGAISFDNMSATYDSKHLALKNITISIQPGQKIGICGRSGSGKSSQLLSLLRLVEIQSGTIWIDKVDLQTLSRDAIRSRLITVPQDPMLVMRDTVRQNLDITDSSISDEEIIHTLQKVKLWHVIQGREGNAQRAVRQPLDLNKAPGNGNSAEALLEASTSQAEPSPCSSLDMVMETLPLSQGQQQLFSLARAILMRPFRGKVVLLDEATSNVDAETDKLMQDLIRAEFKDHTVLTIAHRLDTILDSDMILVLDGGRLVEFGPPLELVQNEDGIFRAMYATV
ncbi:hypothetical protein ACEPPN_016250 [Leptodophora sp. 'Broadleaf-Isolate-01']